MRRMLASLVLGIVVFAGSACTVFVQIPNTPRLQGLSEAQVFSMAPPPEWPVPQPDNPAIAAVDVACGVGPLPTNGYLYAAVSVRGRPPTGPWHRSTSRWCWTARAPWLAIRSAT